MTVGTLRKKALGAPRVSIGPDVLQMAIGSEGTLGIVTDVVVRLRGLLHRDNDGIWCAWF